MKVSELAARAGMQLISPSADAGMEVARVYAADTISELMDVPALCLVDGVQPGCELLEAARRAGAAVMVSPSGLVKTVRTLEELLQP
jgi:biotin carboxylase